jgi:hypothetical protein
MKVRRFMPTRKFALAVALSLSAALIAGCGGDDEAAAVAQSPTPPPPSSPDPAPPPTPPSGSNQAPTIGGTPNGTIMQGTLFSFIPMASDANGDALTFSIVNRPSWATFRTSDGRLRGTPTAANVGSYADIRISVSDGTNTATLPPFTIEVVAVATGSATLSWTPPTMREDGTVLGTALAGYRIYWGTAPGSYANSVTLDGTGLTAYRIDNLTPATWYFVTTSFDSQGTESQYSAMVQKTIM